jgi:hypothetical protein
MPMAVTRGGWVGVRSAASARIQGMCAPGLPLHPSVHGHLRHCFKPSCSQVSPYLHPYLHPTELYAAGAPS